MLILSRTRGQSIDIGHDIKVTVLGVKGGQVRLGVAAPKNVTVHREEVTQRIAAMRDGATPEEAAAAYPIHEETTTS